MTSTQLQQRLQLKIALHLPQLRRTGPMGPSVAQHPHRRATASLGRAAEPLQ